MKKKSYTLVELIVVVIILVILGSIALPLYRRAVIKTRDKDAQAMLKLIHKAENIYHTEFNSYISCTDTEDCNTKLKLYLPTDYWTYSVPNAGKTDFCAQAKSSTGNWSIREDEEEPIEGLCP